MATEQLHLPQLADDQIQEAKVELGKMFRLAAEGVHIEMFSTGIDAVWHELSRDSVRYEDFCLASCGAVIGHGESSGQGHITFIKAYEEKYGKLPKIWFLQRSGKYDEERYKTYLDTGEVTSGWDCTPTHACMPVRA